MSPRFPSLVAWASWARPWLMRIIEDGFSIDNACLVARARMPNLSGVYLRSLGIIGIDDLTTERILRLAGIDPDQQQSKKEHHHV